MQIAVLFDEQSPDHEFYASATARKAILGSGVLQSSHRNIVVRAGTILLNQGLPGNHRQRVEDVFFADSWRLLDANHLRMVSGRSEIFAWVINNVDRNTATELNTVLTTEPTYLGLLAVDLSVPAQLATYRLLMGLLLRVQGLTCSLFWHGFDPESRDPSELDDLTPLGFTRVQWEDIGARSTIFDEFDTVDHFSRLESLRELLSSTLPRGRDDADDLLVVLEDLSPRLAATLGTAARSFSQATSEEDFAQVGLSARRFLLQLANALFPPRSEMVNGRDMSEARVKNRLWAYAEEQLGKPTEGEASRLQAIGGSINRTFKDAHRALHGSEPRNRVRTLLVDLAVLTATLIALAPENNRNPYLAYSPRVSELLHQWLHAGEQ